MTRFQQLKLFLGLAACTEGSVPTFSWIENSYSADGVPHLSVDFHDGRPNDVALLKQYNPITKQANELEENIDKCIFNGHLQDESNVYVTLTGGCPFESNFDVRFYHHRNNFLSILETIQFEGSLHQTYTASIANSFFHDVFINVFFFYFRSCSEASELKDSCLK